MRYFFAIILLFFVKIVFAATFEDGIIAAKQGDYNKAYSIILPYAESGNTKAQCTIGEMYERELGVKQDFLVAAKWYRLAADNGDALGQRQLGYLYSTGKGVIQNYNEAVKWYKLSVNQNDSFAQFLLGDMYQHGKGVPKNNDEAIRLYLLAAEKGIDIAKQNLGFLYGDIKNYKESLKWNKAAAKNGLEGAQYNLALMYMYAEGTPKNNILAHMWLNISNANGKKNAIEVRDELAAEMTSEQISQAQEMANRCLQSNYVNCE